jgi:hypothetical protein
MKSKNTLSMSASRLKAMFKGDEVKAQNPFRSVLL